MQGRKPKPIILHTLHGDPSKHGKDFLRKMANEVEPPPATIEPPEDFSDSETAIWNDAIASAPIGFLRRIDTSVLTAWVVACDLHRRARSMQRSTGLLMQVRAADAKQGEEKAPNTIPVVNPLIHIINRQAQLMIKAAAELGFTPVSRSRVALAGGVGAASQPMVAPGTRVGLEQFLANAPAPPTAH